MALSGLSGLGGLSGLIRSQSYTQKVLATQSANLIAYWPLAETSGTQATDESGNARHGTHSGVTLGQSGIGDNRTAPLYDGVNDYTNVYTAGLAGAFNGAEGTLAVWMQVASSGVWTDATSRYLAILRADASNFVFLRRGPTNTNISAGYTAGGTTESVEITGQSSTGWLHLAVTWSKSADQFKAYLGGAQVGTTQTTLGTWAGSLSSANSVVGAFSTAGAGPHSGWLAHAAVWNTPLSAAQIAALATV